MEREKNRIREEAEERRRKRDNIAARGRDANELKRGLFHSSSEEEGGGGQLKRSTDRDPMKCLVTAIGLDELVPANPDENGGNSKSFTCQNTVMQYKKRSAEFELLNVYQYCAHHRKKSGTTVTQFSGYHDRPTWPLSENFSLWTLSLFKPWEVKCTEVIGDK